MATLVDLGLASIINPDSSIESGALLWWYVSGTATPTDTFTTEALSVTNSNPVVADANGRFPAMWLGAGSFKFILTKADGTPVDPLVTRDPYIVPGAAPTFAPALANFLAGTAPLPIANGGTGPSLVLPVANGGTGGATAAEGRTALGLTPADQATIETGTEDIEYISPAGLLTIRATGAELAAGTNASHYVTPAGLRATSRMMAETGFIYRPDGILEQWGVTAMASGGSSVSGTINFPEEFPSAAWIITGNPINKANGGWGALTLVFPTLTTNDATYVADSADGGEGIDAGNYIRWHALGPGS